MRLRSYQRHGVRDLFRALPRQRRVVAVAPTGSGKTVLAVALLKKWPNKRVLWVAHRIELLRQAVDQLRAAGVAERDIGTLSGPDKGNPEARILVASIDMLRTATVPRADVIVVDEAHRVMAESYLALIRKLPKAMVLGLTATPSRLDGKPLGDVFARMLVVAEPVELIAEGHIAHAACYGIPREQVRDMLRGVKAGKDYAVGALGKAMSKRTLMGDIVKECARLAPGQRTLVFAVNREHGQALLKRFRRAKRPAEYLDGETPDAERAAMVARLTAGETEVVVNVDVLSEGFDCPPVKCIVLARPTKSLTRFLQQIGRASRPYKGRRPIVLDHAGNCWRFGLPETPREWSLDGRESIGGGQAPVRMCPECEAIIAASSKACPECGAEMPVPAQELADQEAELVRLKAQEAERVALAIRAHEIAKRRGYGAAWVKTLLRSIAA